MSAIYNTNSPLLDISIQKAEESFLKKNANDLIRYTEHALKILSQLTLQEDCDGAKRHLQMGKMLFFRGEHERAASSFQKALDIAQKDSSKMSWEVLEMMAEVAFHCISNFSPILAQNILEKGLEIAKEYGHESILWKFNFCLGLCFEKKGEYETACKYYHYAVLLGEATSNLESRNLGMIYRQTGDCLEKLGHPKEALQFLNKAVEIVKEGVRKKNLTSRGEKNLETLTKPTNPSDCENVKEDLEKAKLLFDSKQYDRSMEFFQLAFEVAQRNPSNMSEEVLEMMADVVEECISVFNPKLAANFLLRGLEIAKMYGHKSVLWKFNFCLGFLHKKNGEYETAYKYYEEAVLQGELYLDLNSPNLALIYNNMGTCLEMMERYEESLKCANRAFEIRKANFGLEARETLLSLSNIGTCYFFWKKYSLALEAFETAIGISRNLFGEDHECTKELFDKIKASSAAVTKEERAKKTQLDEFLRKTQSSMKS